MRLKELEILSDFENQHKLVKINIHLKIRINFLWIYVGHWF